MNVILADHAHRVVNIPARSIKSIVGVEHQQIPEEYAGSKTLIRYSYGAGNLFAWLRTVPAAVMAEVEKKTDGTPQAWVPLVDTNGDQSFLLSAIIIAIHGVDPEKCKGAQSRVDFYPFADGTEIKFALCIETPEEIEEIRAALADSIAAAQPAMPAPPMKPAKARRASTRK